MSEDQHPKDGPKVPPGWYRDPVNGHCERWWTGSDWDSSTRPFARELRRKPETSSTSASEKGDLQRYLAKTDAGRIFNPEYDIIADRNTPASSGIVFGIAAALSAFMLHNHWSTLMSGLIAILLGSIGIGRARIVMKGADLARGSLALGLLALTIYFLRI